MIRCIGTTDRIVFAITAQNQKTDNRMPTMDQIRRRESLMQAQICCGSLGGALALWGIAPAFIHRLATGHVPGFEIIVLGGAGVAMGAFCLWLNLLIGRNNRNALWGAFGVALFLVTGNLMTWMLVGSQAVSIFVGILAAGLVLTSWYALHLHRDEPLNEAANTDGEHSKQGTLA